MHHSLLLVFAIGLAGNYVVDAQDAPKTTEPPGLEKAFTEGSEKYKSWFEEIYASGGGLESLSAAIATIVTGTASPAFASWRTWQRENRIATKDKEQKSAEFRTILAALPTEVQVFYSSIDSAYDSLKSEFAATYTAPAPVTTRPIEYYLPLDDDYREYMDSLRDNGVLESIGSVAEAATGKEKSALSVWSVWRTKTRDETFDAEYSSFFTEFPTAMQTFFMSYESRVASLLTKFEATFSRPPFEPDPTTTPNNYEFFLPSEREYYLNHQSLVENGVLASLSSVAATATGSGASAISRWSILQDQAKTTTVDANELISVFNALPTAIQSHIASDRSLRSKILATWTPTAGPWTETYASPGPEGFSTFPTAAGTTSAPLSSATTGTASGGATTASNTPNAAAIGKVVGGGGGVGLVVYGVVVGLVGVVAVLL